MGHTDKLWFSGSEKINAPLTKKRLIAEIHRIANEKWPLPDKMRETRSLVDQYFKSYGNQDMLNANV